MPIEWTISDWTVAPVEPDPDLERLLDEEEAIATRTRQRVSLWTDDLIRYATRPVADNTTVYHAPRGSIGFTALDDEGHPAPEIRATDNSVLYIPPEIEPDDPETVRWAAPERNLQVGDRVRWTAVNNQHGEGTVVEVRRLMNVHELRNIPDWVPRDTRHQTYRVRYDDGRTAEPVIAWFRIQRRLETDE